MAKKIGTLIKEARTEAGFTQEQLAKKIKGLSAADIGKAERGEIDLTQDQLKEIAKATGVTQKSLLDAAKGSSAKKTSSAKTSAAKKTSSAKKSSDTSVTLTATEKKLLNAYRKADSDTQEKVQQILLSKDAAGDMVQQLLEGAIKKLTGKK